MKPQNISASLNSSAMSPGASEQQIEAARYTVIRRLAPCLHHHTVRPLQPIELISGVMQHKFCAGEPDLQSVRAEAEKINGFAKAALAECVNMSTWLAPEAGVLTSVGSGVSECVGLMENLLHFCGFSLVNEVEDTTAQVQRNAVRMVLVAALFELTDSLGEPAALTLSAITSPKEVIVSLTVTQRLEGAIDRYDDGCRNLTWADVQALAAAENVRLSREDGRVMMSFAIESAD